jgi:hypothetical protein
MNLKHIELEHMIDAQSWAERNGLLEQHPREAYLPPGYATGLKDIDHAPLAVMRGVNFPDWPGHDVNRVLPLVPLRWWLVLSALLCLSCAVAYSLLA